MTGDFRVEWALHCYREALARRTPDSTPECPVWVGERPKLTHPLRGMPDFRGERRGQLTVLGYLGARLVVGSTDRVRHLYLVRCDCGRMEQRKYSTLRRATTSGLAGRCRQCDGEANARWRAAHAAAAAKPE